MADQKTRDVAGIQHFLTPQQMAEEIVRLDALLNRYRWRTVEHDGPPPCDDETVYLGVNTNGFAACFNMMNPDGSCLMGTAECCTCVMSCLRWWRVLDRPTDHRVGPAGRETGYAYPRGVEGRS